MVPVAGSAYTYAYATLGELFAWIIGWDLVLEYAVGAATVANGWSGYFQSVLAKFGVAPSRGAQPVRPSSTTPAAGEFVRHSGIVNLPAVIIVAHRHVRAGQGHSGERRLQRHDGGVQAGGGAVRHPGRRVLRQSGQLDAVRAVRLDRRQLLRATRCSARPTPAAQPVGMIAGAAIIFFAYIGFDSVSTHAEEAKNPRRDVPIGIIASLVICTVLYIAVVAVLTGMVPVRPDQRRRRRLRRLQTGGPAVGRVHHRGRRRRRHHVGAAGHDAVGAARLPRFFFFLLAGFITLRIC